MPREIYTPSGWVGLVTGPAPVVPTRSAFDIPGAIDAPFCLPLATTATYEAGTDTKTASLRTLAGGAVNSAYWSVNFTQAAITDPVVTWRHPTTGVPWTFPWATRMPPSYVPPLGTAPYTPDGATYVLNPDGRYGYDVYRPIKVSSTEWTTPYQPNIIDFWGSLISGGARAAGISYANGVIHSTWAARALAGEITVFPHAIAFSIPLTHLKEVPTAGDGQLAYNGSGQAVAVWPARFQDSFAYSGNIPMGSWFAIPQSTNIEALITSLGFGSLPVAAALMRTLYYRGAVVTDQSTSRAMYAQPGTSSVALTQLDQAWDACINYLCRVTNITASTPGGGAYLGNASNRLLPLHLALAA